MSSCTSRCRSMPEQAIGAHDLVRANAAARRPRRRSDKRCAHRRHRRSPDASPAPPPPPKGAGRTASCASVQSLLTPRALERAASCVARCRAPRRKRRRRGTSPTASQAESDQVLMGRDARHKCGANAAQSRRHRQFEFKCAQSRSQPVRAPPRETARMTERDQHWIGRPARGRNARERARPKHRQLAERGLPPARCRSRRPSVAAARSSVITPARTQRRLSFVDLAGEIVDMQMAKRAYEASGEDHPHRGRNVERRCSTRSPEAITSPPRASPSDP